MELHFQCMHICNACAFRHASFFPSRTTGEAIAHGNDPTPETDSAVTVMSKCCVSQASGRHDNVTFQFK